MTSFLLVVLLLGGAQSMPRLVKRSDDVDPLEAVVQKLTADMLQVQAKLETLNHHVAFLVQLPGNSPSTNTATAPPSGPYKFSQVVLNDGGGYDPVLGVFNAPYPGVYSFSLQIFLRGPQRAMIDIKRNGGIISRMSIDTITLGRNGEDSDSTTVTVRLHAGDKVWVESGSGAHTYVGDYHTFFTGNLLYSD